jgi:hypothetical protein
VPGREDPKVVETDQAVKVKPGARLFHGHESARMLELEGQELAGFWRRGAALQVDIVAASVILLLALFAAGALFSRIDKNQQRRVAAGLRAFNNSSFVKHFQHGEGPEAEPRKTAGAAVGKDEEEDVHLKFGFFDNLYSLFYLTLYFGLSNYFGNGRTPGKRLLGIRAVSLVHHRLSLWHSFERALGYGASMLELGFGFVQFFIHPNRRTVHDRIAETIVIRERRGNV